MKECCKRKENLKREGNHYRCQVCGCRHYEMTAEKGQLGLKGKGI